MKKEIYLSNYKLENQHWWFMGRRAILNDLLRRTFKKKSNKILAIGCGTGAELNFLSQYGEVTGLDPSKDAVQFCQETSPQKVILGNAEHLPFKDNHFDAIALFDVLEHIKNHEEAIQEVFRVLKKGGLCFITVPAFSFLWSEADVMLEHHRRYSKKQLKTPLLKHGFKIKKISYFNFFLFPVVFVIRQIKKLLKPWVGYSYEVKETPKILNFLLKNLFAAEKYFLRRINIPFGVSLVCIAQK